MRFATLSHHESPPAKVDFVRCLEFCDFMRTLTDPEKLRRQKGMEKQIEKAFRIEGSKELKKT